MNKLIGLLALLCMFAPAGLLAQSKLQGKDNTFVMKAAKGDKAEIAMGDLALKNSNNPDVKQFAQTLVTDHQQAYDKLQSDVASKNNVTLPTAPAPSQTAEKDKLASKKGADFDRAFLQEQIKDHKQDIAEFKNEAQNGQNNDVKQYAQNTVATLQKHLQMAQDAMNKLQAQK